jgi:hypothetical protein
MFGLCRKTTAAAAAAPKAITGHGSPNAHARRGSEAADAIDATDA